MAHLNNGDVVRTTDGEPITVLSELGEGGCAPTFENTKNLFRIVENPTEKSQFF